MEGKGDLELFSFFNYEKLRDFFVYYNCSRTSRERLGEDYCCFRLLLFAQDQTTIGVKGRVVDRDRGGNAKDYERGMNLTTEPN